MATRCIWIPESCPGQAIALVGEARHSLHLIDSNLRPLRLKIRGGSIFSQTDSVGMR